jgi:hypothetical protein
MGGMADSETAGAPLYPWGYTFLLAFPFALLAVALGVAMSKGSAGTAIGFVAILLAGAAEILVALVGVARLACGHGGRYPALRGLTALAGLLGVLLLGLG